jgi:hypothetical protein
MELRLSFCFSAPLLHVTYLHDAQQLSIQSRPSEVNSELAGIQRAPSTRGEKQNCPYAAVRSNCRIRGSFLLPLSDQSSAFWETESFILNDS